MSIFNQQVFWNSKSTEHYICPKSSFRSFFFPGLLFICCYWMPRITVYRHTLGVFHELGYKREEKTNTQWQFPSLHCACLCHCDCSTGRMFKPSRAILGGVTAPKLCGLLRGSCLWPSQSQQEDVVAGWKWGLICCGWRSHQKRNESGFPGSLYLEVVLRRRCFLGSVITGTNC